MTATNLLLLKILEDLNREDITSADIHDLDTTEINGDLNEYYFKNKELEYESKMKVLNDNLEHEKKSIRKEITKIKKEYKKSSEKIDKEISSFKNKIKRAREDMLKKLEGLEGEERIALEAKLKSEIGQDEIKLKAMDELKTKKLAEPAPIKDKKIEDLEEAIKNTTIKSMVEEKNTKFQAEYKSKNGKEYDGEKRYLDAKDLQKKLDELKASKKQLETFKEQKLKYTCPKGKEIFDMAKFILNNPLESDILCIDEKTVKNLKKKKTDLIFDSLKYLQSYNVIAREDIETETYNLYKLNLKACFAPQKHKIDNRDIYGEILPLLISFLKYDDSYKVDAFLDHIDVLIDYLFAEPKKFSQNYRKENALFTAIADSENQKKIIIHINEDDEDTLFTNVEKDYYIEFDDFSNKILNWTAEHTYTRKLSSIYRISAGGKPVHHKENLLKNAIQNNEKLTIQIDEYDEYTIFKNVQAQLLNPDDKDLITISWDAHYHAKKLEDIYNILIETEDEKALETDSGSPANIQQGFMSHQQKYNIPDGDKHKVILELDVNLSEFFDIKPLTNQIMYKTESEKEQFRKEYSELDICKEENIKNMKNKFYVTANDTTDEILHVVKRCIPGAKILEPSEINDKFKAMIKSICD